MTRESWTLGVEETNATPTVLFDLDGTLLDTHDLMERSFRHALERLGRPFDRSVEWYITQRVVDVFGDDEQGQLGMDLYRTHYVEHSARLARPYAGALDLLTELRERGWRTGIVSNKEGERIRLHISELRLAGALDVVVGTEDTVKRKPESDPLILARLHLGDASCLIYVGDNPVDITSARLAGILPVAAGWGFFPRTALMRRNPWKFAASMEDLTRILGDVRV